MSVDFVYLSRDKFDTPCHIRYQFRIVSISCNPSFVLSINGHQFTVIEVDCTDIQPPVVDSIELFAGMLRMFASFDASKILKSRWFALQKLELTQRNLLNNSVAIAHSIVLWTGQDTGVELDLALALRTDGMDRP